ncbi:MAG: FAD:protein FMN transferase [Anaerocolumna sp.]
MNRKILAVLMIVISLTHLTACSTDSNLNRYDAQFLVLFNTATKIVGYAKTKEEFGAYSQMIYDELKTYHELYDIYNDYEGVHNIKTINDNAGVAPVKVDQKIIDLLIFGKEAYQETDGKVNITMGSVLKVWHDYREEGSEDPLSAKVPDLELLQEKNKHTDINKLIIDEENSTVYLEDPQMRLDVGAIAKGYATEQVSHYAYDHGFIHGMISVGGNIQTIGDKVGKDEKWNVGIQNPDEESEQEYLYVLDLSNKTLVSSGDYERYYTVDGVRYHHIIDPDTLMPSTYFTAVSILTDNGGYADGLSTAIFNMSYEDGLDLIESLSDTEALWVFKDGSMKYSSGFSDYIHKE